MAELFVAGTFAFWVLMAVEIILLFLFVANENGFGATISIIAYGLILQFFGNFNIIGLSLANWPFVLMFFFSYFIIGALWARYKWRLLVSEYIESYEEEKRGFLRNKGVTGTKVPEEYKAEWFKTLQNMTGRFSAGGRVYRKLHEAPNAYEYKGKWIGWAAYWVPSMIYYFANDLVRQVFKSLFKFFVEGMQKIADKKFEGIKDDFTVKAPPKPDDYYTAKPKD